MCRLLRICLKSSGSGLARTNRKDHSTTRAKAMNGQKNLKKSCACSESELKSRKRNTTEVATGLVPAEHPPWAAADTIRQVFVPGAKADTSRLFRLQANETSRISETIRFSTYDSSRLHSGNCVSTHRVLMRPKLSWISMRPLTKHVKTQECSTLYTISLVKTLSSCSCS